jgi:hypothetical protein
VLQIYEAPLLNTYCAQWNTLMDFALRDEPTIRAQYLGSLYEFSSYADRGMDPMLLGSDGRPYFAAMPHHSSEGGAIFAFDPSKNEVACLGDIDRLAGTKRPGTRPNMVHASAFEMNGSIYFVGQDPHYGGWGFPLDPGEEPPTYQGSPIAVYDIQSGKTRGLGIPLDGQPAVFRITGDPVRNVLYVRRGYHRTAHGPLAWYALSLDENGNITGRPRPFPFPQHPCHPSQILVAADGTIFAVAPHESYKTYERRKQLREKTEDIRPQCEVYRCDGELRQARRIGTVDGTWDITWLAFQNGRAFAIGYTRDHLYRLDMRTGAVQRLGAWPQNVLGRHGHAILHDGTIYYIEFRPAKVDGKHIFGRTAGIHSIQPATGKTRYHGVVVDQAGRRPKDLNYFCFLKDGRLFAAGTVFGLPTDRNYMPRYRDTEPYRLDFAAFAIDKLPPGKPP